MSDLNDLQASEINMLRQLLRWISGVLPSAAGTDKEPAAKVICCYLTLGELRAIKAACDCVNGAPS